jgi:hypothetical protein
VQGKIQIEKGNKYSARFRVNKKEENYERKHIIMQKRLRIKIRDVKL